MMQLTKYLITALGIFALLLAHPSGGFAQRGSQRLFEAFEGGKSGLIDINGNWILKPTFDSIDYVEYHRVYFFEDSLIGVANLNGKVNVRPVWTEIMYDDDGLASATDARGTTYINVLNGKRICGYFKEMSFLADGLVSVLDSSGKWGAINASGRLVVPCAFDSLDEFSGGKAWAWQHGRQLFIDHYGVETDSPDYYNKYRPSWYGAHTFQTEGKWGAVDQRGDTVVQPEYDYLYYSASEPWRTFCLDGKCGVFDTSGRMVVQPKYDCLRHFSATSTNIASLNHKWGFIDGAEQVVVPFQFDHLNFLIDTLYAASVNGKWGILSRSGRWVLHPRFERIRSTFYDEDEEEEEEPITYGRGRWRRTSSVSVASFNKTSEDGALSPAGIRVFPNPTRGQLSIELRLQDHGSYRLYDAKGAVVRSGVLEQPITSLDITALAAGVYTMLVQEDGKTSKISVTKL